MLQNNIINSYNSIQNEDTEENFVDNKLIELSTKFTFYTGLFTLIFLISGDLSLFLVSSSNLHIFKFINIYVLISILFFANTFYKFLDGIFYKIIYYNFDQINKSDVFKYICLVSLCGFEALLSGVNENVGDYNSVKIKYSIIIMIVLLDFILIQIILQITTGSKSISNSISQKKNNIKIIYSIPVIFFTMGLIIYKIVFSVLFYYNYKILTINDGGLILGVLVFTTGIIIFSQITFIDFIKKQNPNQNQNVELVEPNGQIQIV